MDEQTLPSHEQLQEFGRRALGPLMVEVAQIAIHTSVELALSDAAFAATQMLITVANAADVDPDVLADCVARAVRHRQEHP